MTVLQQAISDDGGADAPAAGGLAGDGGADPVPPRAGVHRDLRARAGAPEDGLPDRRTRCCCSPPPGTGALESAVANLIAPGDVARGRLLRQVRRSAGRSCARPTAPRPCHLEFEWGEKVDPAEVERALAERGGEREGALHDPVRDVDRRPERRARAGRGRRRARRRERRRRRLRPRRGRPADRRVGRRRRRVRLAEGADVAARAWRSPRSPSARSRSPPTPARAARAATTSTGSRTLKGQRKEPPDSPFTPAVTLFRALDVALEHDRGGDAARRCSSATRCSAAPRARRSRAWASSCSAPRTRTPTS